MDKLESIVLLVEQNSKLNRRNLFKLGSFFAGASVFARCVPAITTRSAGNINVMSYDASISEQEVSELALQAKREYDKITKFLDRDYARTIYIILGDYDKARALRDASTIEMPKNLVSRKRTSTAHELTHLIAGKPDLMLSEGLAVYIQDKLGEHGAFPNYGFDLDELTIKGTKDLFQNQIPSLSSATQFIDYPTRDKRRFLGYIMAGSFVKYLVDDVLKGNISKFMGIYHSGDYKKYAGKSFEELEKGWVDMLKKR